MALSRRFYNIWYRMKSRCYDNRDISYKNYGGKGITVCKEWLSFKVFKKDMYPKYKENLMIDRIDNIKGYYKENCKWSTRKEQNNNKSNVKKITFKGKTQNLSEWAQYLNIKRSTIAQRYYVYKWNIEKCLGGVL